MYIYVTPCGVMQPLHVLDPREKDILHSMTNRVFTYPTFWNAPLLSCLPRFSLLMEGDFLPFIIQSRSSSKVNAEARGGASPRELSLFIFQQLLSREIFSFLISISESLFFQILVSNLFSHFSQNPSLSQRYVQFSEIHQGIYF